ncbi:MAG: protein phosphatase [Actinobacteria bacterium]|nr:protein phosphatase [Actinomycetota bacterium]
MGVSFDPVSPYEREQQPDYGVYLDAKWEPPWPHEHVDWPDFGVPSDPAAFRGALAGALQRVSRGERVELGCLGGHGRTGTALACLAVMAGEPPSTAIDWVREHYCGDAVETDEQRSFVASFQ